MNCNRVQKEIGAWLDGEIEGRDSDDLRQHLSICPRCSEAKHQMVSLSRILMEIQVPEPSHALKSRIKGSFQQVHRPATQTVWRRIALGGLVVPKPVFASLVILSLAGFWFTFQAGRNTSTSVTTVTTAEISNQAAVDSPTRTVTETVYVEVPVIQQMTVFKTIYVKAGTREEEKKPNLATKRGQEELPAFNSTSTSSGLSSDVDLKGFQPPAQMNARIVKEATNDEK